MNFYHLLAASPLFQGIEESKYDELLSCLNSRITTFHKDETIIQKGSTLDEFGFVLSGHLHIVRYDYWGNRNILSELSEGDLFAESYACIPEKEVELSVVAADKCEILFLKADHITANCPHSCTYHTQLAKNLLAIIAMKNILLTKKINHLSKRSTREKLLSYLQDISVEKHSPSFLIPFNRQELADYLCVDRSALSSELSKMKKEGILQYEKNSFHLLQTSLKMS